MNTFDSEIAGKNVLVFGVGRQGGGEGDAAWLKLHGATVRLSDRDLTLVSEGQTQEQIDWADLIIKNPGVPDDHKLIKYAKSLNKPVYTSIAIFVKYAQIETIGVTGTRGKSTTVALITKLLETAYPGSIISGGNIAGTSCLTLFDEQQNKKFAVLELSSFQLHNFHDLHVSPDIAIITNLYPDHLNRYQSMQDYQSDKEAICRYQQGSEPCFYNADNQGAVAISRLSPGKKIAFSASSVFNWQTELPGVHNRENIAAMFALAQSLGISEVICRQVVKDFLGMPFRQQVIAQIKGVTYINDTTSTTPTAALYALKAATTPTIWITGGDSKNLPYAELLDEVKLNKFLKNIIILGSLNIRDYTEELRRISGDKILATVTSMSQALELARSNASSGDTVLLSPGFASFDLFQNEFDRGRQFNDVVKSYAQN